MNALLQSISSFATSAIQDILDERDVLREERENNNRWLVDLASRLGVNINVRCMHGVRQELGSRVVQLLQAKAVLESGLEDAQKQIDDLQNKLRGQEF